MRLTAEEHPETVKRYAHVKPARGRGAKACHARWPGEFLLAFIGFAVHWFGLLLG